MPCLLAAALLGSSAMSMSWGSKCHRWGSLNNCFFLSQSWRPGVQGLSVCRWVHSKASLLGAQMAAFSFVFTCSPLRVCVLITPSYKDTG